MLTAICSALSCSDPNLEFVASPAYAPPEVSVDPELMQQYQKEFEAVVDQPLPEDDEDF